ncbi:uncharacterized protein LOC143232051 isoform X1 [Tachypleus tridentatus]|uniref:uncharacterized protein LOC143232051 isoform X1 n=1 Tax=Tachypleus tridentatus TaxID=6853 RepID=UPI003FCF67C9
METPVVSKGAVVANEEAPETDTNVSEDLAPMPDSSNSKSHDFLEEETHFSSSADEYSFHSVESVVSHEERDPSVISAGEEEKLDSRSDSTPEAKSEETSHLKSEWESENIGKDEGKGEGTKDDQLKLREAESKRAVYERACKETKNNLTSKTELIDIVSDVKTISIKEKFEKGELESEFYLEKQEKTRRQKEEDLNVFSETSTAAGARSLFRQIDAANSSSSSPVKSPSDHKRTWEVASSTRTSSAVVKCSDPGIKDKIEIDPAQLSQRFQFFENYREESKERKQFQFISPDETIEDSLGKDSNIVRSSDAVHEVIVTDTTKKMLNKFKQLENQPNGSEAPAGPKPVRSITPPPESDGDRECKHSSEARQRSTVVRCSYKNEDNLVWDTDKAKNLRSKFEHWQPSFEQDKTKNEDEFIPETDMAKNLRAKFEAIQEENIKAKEKPKPTTKKFVGSGTGESCDICQRRLYPVEKIELGGLIVHQNCFRCAHCNSALRLENYSTSGGKIYCNQHFKLLALSRTSQNTSAETGQEAMSDTGHETMSESGHETMSESGRETMSEIGQETMSEASHETLSEVGDETMSETENVSKPTSAQAQNE